MASVSAWWSVVIRLFSRDESDEMACLLIVIKDSYNKKVSPFNIDKKEKALIPVKVNISTVLKNVIEISEVNHLIELKFRITLVWYENRVNITISKETKP